MPDLLLLLGVISVADNGNCTHTVFEFLPFAVGKVKVEGVDIFLEMRNLRRARNGHYPRRLVPQPA